MLRDRAPGDYAYGSRRDGGRARSRHRMGLRAYPIDRPLYRAAQCGQRSLDFLLECVRWKRCDVLQQGCLRWSG